MGYMNGEETQLAEWPERREDMLGRMRLRRNWKGVAA